MGSEWERAAGIAGVPPRGPGSIRLPKASLGVAAFRSHSEYFPRGTGFHESDCGGFIVMPQVWLFLPHSFSS